MILFLLLLPFASAYLEETFSQEHSRGLVVSDHCSLFGYHNRTELRYHNSDTLQTQVISTIMAVNEECDLVLFGFPSDNAVILWRPLLNTFKTIRPDAAVVQVEAKRFGFSVDVQNQTWAVGAPGTPNSAANNYEGATLGYAFVYNGDELQSCRSLYDTYGYPLGTGVKIANFKNTKDYYKHLKIDTRYVNVFDNDDVLQQITDREMISFQKVCITPQQPYYDTGPIDIKKIDYFHYQQFGYSVKLSGTHTQFGTALFVSAPGDTARFMEDNDGKNYGRVYVWDSYIWQSQDESVPTITWWDYSIFSPLIPPDLGTGTYRGFGRTMSVSRATLAVSTYPLYDNTREPFIIIYDCSPEMNTASDCEESAERGVSINDLPGNVLGYLTNEMLAYTDGKTRLPYIPANTVGDGLPDFQNNFIGKKIGVAGSNVIMHDPQNHKIYRFGSNAAFRETHAATGETAFGTNTEHWLHQTEDQLTHLWPCPRGSTSDKEFCSYEDTRCVDRNCPLCQLQYFSDDGWLPFCDPCPKNFSTYEEGQTHCVPFVKPIISGISLTDTRNIIIAIVFSVVVVGSLVVYFQIKSQRGRRSRRI